MLVQWPGCASTDTPWLTPGVILGCLGVCLFCSCSLFCSCVEGLLCVPDLYPQVENALA